MANHTLSWPKNPTPKAQRFRCLPVLDVTTGNHTGDHKPLELPLEGSGQGGLRSLVLRGTGRKRQSTSVCVPVTSQDLPLMQCGIQAFLIYNVYAYSLGLGLRWTLWGKSKC